MAEFYITNPMRMRQVNRTSRIQAVNSGQINVVFIRLFKYMAQVAVGLKSIGLAVSMSCFMRV
jgi:hypothetical protein